MDPSLDLSSLPIPFTMYSLQSKNIATMFYVTFPPVTYAEICREPTKGQLAISVLTIFKYLVSTPINLFVQE